MLQGFLSSRRALQTLEVGCAYGLSSLFICEILAGHPGAKHTIVDPFQTSQYRRIGVQKLEKAGFDFWELIEEGSEFALPELCRKGARFDFCLIDGYHTFDHTLLDFFYINRMLKVGGIVAIDDTDSPAINKMAHYAATYPCYRVVGTLGNRGWRRKALNAAKTALAWAAMPLTKLAGLHMSQEVLDGTIVRPSLIRSCDTSTMIVFEKISEDGRNCEWYQHF